MESGALLRSFTCSIGTTSVSKSMFEGPGLIFVNNSSLSSFSKMPMEGLTYGSKLIYAPMRHKMTLVPSVKTSDITLADSCQNGSFKTGLQPKATFPSGFEALVTEVCDDTEVAELKIKVGDFELHLKRKIENIGSAAPVVSAVPTVPSPAMNGATTAAPPPSLPKSSVEKNSPFTNVSTEKSTKLAALESSGTESFVIVSSPSVGTFRRGRTLKGKKQTPICKEGDTIKEGQVIGYLDQFGSELPVKSDVGGEVLKVLYDDVEAVGYGDPLIAVLPSFQ